MLPVQGKIIKRSAMVSPLDIMDWQVLRITGRGDFACQGSCKANGADGFELALCLISRGLEGVDVLF